MIKNLGQFILITISCLWPNNVSSFVKLNFSFADTVFSINCAAKIAKKPESVIDWNNSLPIASKLYPNVLITLASIFIKQKTKEQQPFKMSMFELWLERVLNILKVLR